MLKKLALNILRVKSVILFNVTKVFPLSGNVILFGSSYGKYYSDNSKYVYEYVIETARDLTPVWVTKNRKVHRNLKDIGHECVIAGSIKYFRYLHSSKIGLFTNNIKDIFVFNLIPKGFQLIALRHGKSLKKVRHSVVGYEIKKEEKKEREVENELIKFSISTSEFVSEIQEKDLLYGKEKHIVTGYPRNDPLLSPVEDDIKKWWGDYLGDLSPCKTILYCPSWRHGREPTQFFPFTDFKKEELFQFLEEKKILLLLRPHKNDLNRYSYFFDLYNSLSKSTNWIKKLTHEDISDVNSILPLMDCLVTDYSSIYHDYLLLDRPIIFIPYDFDAFNSANGFHVDYLKWIPGPNVRTFDEFRDHLDFISNDLDIMKDKRSQYTMKIHQYLDPKSTERVYELIRSI